MKDSLEKSELSTRILFNELWFEDHIIYFLINLQDIFPVCIFEMSKLTILQLMVQKILHPSKKIFYEYQVYKSTLCVWVCGVVKLCIDRVGAITSKTIHFNRFSFIKHRLMSSVFKLFSSLGTSINLFDNLAKPKRSKLCYLQHIQ